MVNPSVVGQLDQQRCAFGAALGLYNDAMIILCLALSRLLEPVHQDREAGSCR